MRESIKILSIYIVVLYGGMFCGLISKSICNLEDPVYLISVETWDLFLKDDFAFITPLMFQFLCLLHVQVDCFIL